MKLAAAAAALLLLPSLAASALPAGSNSPGPFTPNGGPGFAQKWRKTQAIKALRAEALELRVADGGTLSPTHRAEIQEKLDRIVAGNY